MTAWRERRAGEPAARLAGDGVARATPRGLVDAGPIGCAALPPGSALAWLRPTPRRRSRGDRDKPGQLARRRADQCGPPLVRLRAAMTGASVLVDEGLVAGVPESSADCAPASRRRRTAW